MKQGWLLRRKLNGTTTWQNPKWKPRIATVDSCFDLLGSRQHGVAAKRKATGWLTDHPLNAHNGNDLRWNSSADCGLANVTHLVDYRSTSRPLHAPPPHRADETCNSWLSLCTPSCLCPVKLSFLRSNQCYAFICNNKHFFEKQKYCTPEKNKKFVIFHP